MLNEWCLASFSDDNLGGFGNLIPRSLTEEFLDELGLSGNQRKNYRCAVDSLNRYLHIEIISLEDLDREDIFGYREWLIDYYSRTTAQWYMSAVSSFLSWAVIKGKCRGIGHNVRVFKDSVPKVASLEYAEALSVIGKAKEKSSTLKGKRDCAIANLMLRCALRPSEVHEADVRDVRFDAAGECSIIVQGWGKHSKDQVVVLDSSTAKALVDYLVSRDRPSMNEPLFVSHSVRSRGARLSERSIREVMKSLLSDAGVTRSGISAYSLRMSSVTFALEGGASLVETCKVVRDRNISYGPLGSSKTFGSNLQPKHVEEDVPESRSGHSFLISKQELFMMMECFHQSDWLVIDIDEIGDFSIELAAR